MAALDVVEAAVLTWQAEDARLSGVRRAVNVEEALRGRSGFAARL